MASQAAANALNRASSLASKKLLGIPHQAITRIPLPDPTKFIKREGEAEKRKTAETQ
ncbi:hypothetical protein K443DRAFT_687045 [Laccaria amethystina LaAM-08-1]|uniref:Uncharacterized protein n=1 Tax=Laccaria amethystina LaAM-08-1 TaxID=1095629 RepID=A0A0C9WQF6_9AGAR|nr:hypothetical protein K443DRAFT_687045 [Laccaria amethystina LaAM-08-1]